VPHGVCGDRYRQEVLVGCNRCTAEIGPYQPAGRALPGKALQRGFANVVLGFVDIQQSRHANGEGVVVEGDVGAVGQQAPFDASRQGWAGRLDAEFSTGVHAQLPQLVAPLAVLEYQFIAQFAAPTGATEHQRNAL